MIDWLEDELIPEHLVLDGNTYNDGQQRATRSIRLKPGYHSKDAHIKISPGLNCN